MSDYVSRAPGPRHRRFRCALVARKPGVATAAIVTAGRGWRSEVILGLLAIPFQAILMKLKASLPVLAELLLIGALDQALLRVLELSGQVDGAGTDVSAGSAVDTICHTVREQG
ncbi:MAG: hypothetical protein ACE37N_02030 [Pseudohongiellaceae bacterium]